MDWGTLRRDARFWAAVVLLVKSVLFYLVPSFPQEVWSSLDALVAVVLAIMAGSGAVQVARQIRAARAMRKWD